MVARRLEIGAGGRAGQVVGLAVGQLPGFDAFAGAGQVAVADLGQRFAAFPQGQGVLEGQAAGLQFGDHVRQLVAGLFVVQIVASLGGCLQSAVGVHQHGRHRLVVADERLREVGAVTFGDRLLDAGQGAAITRSRCCEPRPNHQRVPA